MILSFANPPVKTKTGTVATLDELKHQLNIPVGFTDDDAILTGLLATAVEMVEDDTHSDVLETVNVLEYWLNLDKSASQLNPFIRIYQAPAKSFSKIETTTDGETWTILSAADYTIESKFNCVEITFLKTVTASGVKFTFTTGYTDATRPKRLKQAVILKAADLFETERSNYVLGAPVANNNVYLNLILPHTRIYW